MTDPATQPHAIEIHLTDLRQLFESLDPSPFWEKDLDNDAHEYIVSCARDLPRGAAPSLVIRLDDPVATDEQRANVTAAVHAHFARYADAERRRLRTLFRLGRISLLIGLAFLGGSIGAGRALTTAFPRSSLAELASQSLSIGGWVAMWRPLEIFLYEWWPIRRDCRRFERMSAMPVRISPRAGRAGG